MNRDRAIEILIGLQDGSGSTYEAIRMAIDALQNKSRLFGDCSKCIHTYGTLGCCTTVSNEWLYDCEHGMEQYKNAKAEPQKSYPTEWCEQCNLWEDNKCVGAAQCKRIIEALKQVTSEDLISRVETINAITETLDAIDHVPKWVFDKLTSAIEILPPADRPKSEWTTDEVAELLANIFGDECACNWSGNDEWLPGVCKYAETTCPSPKEANGCWKQFLIQGGAGWVRR